MHLQPYRLLLSFISLYPERISRLGIAIEQILTLQCVISGVPINVIIGKIFFKHDKSHIREKKEAIQ